MWQEALGCAGWQHHDVGSFDLPEPANWCLNRACSCHVQSVEPMGSFSGWYWPGQEPPNPDNVYNEFDVAIIKLRTPIFSTIEKIKILSRTDFGAGGVFESLGVAVSRQARMGQARMCSAAQAPPPSILPTPLLRGLQLHNYIALKPTQDVAPNQLLAVAGFGAGSTLNAAAVAFVSSPIIPTGRTTQLLAGQFSAVLFTISGFVRWVATPSPTLPLGTVCFNVKMCLTRLKLLGLSLERYKKG